MMELQPILPHRDKAGYIAARNTRVIRDTIQEFIEFKSELIRKYGAADKDDRGHKTGTVSIEPNSPHFQDFLKEFDAIKNIEHEVDLMTMKYDEVIGLLNGEEILALDWMFDE